MKTKLSKNKKIILLISGLGILTTSIVTPVVVINNKNDNQEKENKEDVEKVIKILEEKTSQQRIIILPSDSSGNIITNNKEKIISKLKELIGNSNLKNVSIKVSMNQDQEISTSKQEIIVKVSKGKHSKIVSSSRAYFVNRTRTAQEIILEIKDKDILIPANVSTQNQNEIQDAIRNQLKKENQTLSEDDLLKITINNIESLTPVKKVEINLIIKEENTIKELTINVKKINLLKNSKIINGRYGTIFQDSFGNLWAMGFETPFQVLKVNSNGSSYLSEGWSNKNTKVLLKGSNITNGLGGTIFQDSFKNLWAMGLKTKLQVLKVNLDGDGYVNEGWTDVTTQGLLKNSNIFDGRYGTIFQDSFKNLWAMSFGTPLQVLKAKSNGTGYVSQGWTNDNTQGLLKDSIISDGESGTIFQDSFGNLWAMSFETKLQVLRVNSNSNSYVNEGWTDVTTQGLLKNSNIIDGRNGTIFQDSFGNLWAMGILRKFQVLKVNSNGFGYVNEGWTDVATEGLLKNSKIDDGRNGTIFQDSFENLWAMGLRTKLQVLKVNSDGYENEWVNDNNKDTGDELLKNSNITNGLGGTIFQDSFGNLWAMGLRTKLQVLKVNSDCDGYVNQGWTDITTEGLLKNSNIDDGRYGTIFQDEFKNLWTMGSGTQLQVLVTNSVNTSYINSWLYEEDKK